MHTLIEAYSLFFSSSAVTDVDADVAFQMIHTEISLFHLFNTAYKLLFLLLLLLLILACYIVMALSQDAYVCVCVGRVLFFVQDLHVHILGAGHDLAIDHFLDHGAYTLGHHGLGCTETQRQC